jgi:hypothetical protein
MITPVFHPSTQASVMRATGLRRLLMLSVFSEARERRLHRSDPWSPRDSVPMQYTSAISASGT